MKQWPQEVIPDEDTLYMRVHVIHVKNGQLQPGAFQDHEGAMSANWKRYCPTPEDARAKAKTPEKNGVVSAVTGTVREVPQVVEHTPDEARNDRSHTSIIGPKNSETRFKLRKAFAWVLPVPEQVAP